MIRENVPAAGEAVLIDEQDGETHVLVDVLPITRLVVDRGLFERVRQVLSARDVAVKNPRPKAMAGERSS
jgi:hypothetical protein